MAFDWNRMPDAMMVLDADGFLAASNTRFSRTVGPMSILKGIGWIEVREDGMGPGRGGP